MSTSNQFLTKRIQKFTWDQAVDGNLANNVSTSIGTLPIGALIIGGAIHVVTDVTDADAGDDSTVAFGYTGATAAFWAATAVSTLEAGKLLSILPGNYPTANDAAEDTAVKMAELVDASWILLDADKEVLLTMGDDQAANAGKINLYIEYYIST
jgi:hypothetical protein